VLVELSVMEQRYQAVLGVVQDGWKVTEVADRLGVSRQSVHNWIARYEAGGLPALADRSHRPASCPHQTSGEIEAEICEVRRLHPGWGPRRIEHELARAGIDPVPSRSAIYRCLRRHGLVELRRRRKRREEFRRRQRDRPMQLWQMDVMGGVLLDDATELKVVTGVDDHSRFCVAAGLVRRATSKAVCAVLSRSLATYGIPDEILTDNGKVFTGRFGPQPAEVLFDRICRENGISHRHNAVRSPASACSTPVVTVPGQRYSESGVNVTAPPRVRSVPESHRRDELGSSSRSRCQRLRRPCSLERSKIAKRAWSVASAGRSVTASIARRPDSERMFTSVSLRRRCGHTWMTATSREPIYCQRDDQRDRRDGDGERDEGG
jgi:transposase